MLFSVTGTTLDKPQEELVTISVQFESYVGAEFGSKLGGQFLLGLTCKEVLVFEALFNVSRVCFSETYTKERVLWFGNNEGDVNLGWCLSSIAWCGAPPPVSGGDVVELEADFWACGGKE
ncbi:hypothetical protein V6N13_028534 [Hibiscus sabdariffa]